MPPDSTAWRNRIVRYGEMPADQFLAHPLNPNKHPQEQRDATKGSLDELGWIKPVIVNTSGYLVDGHDRIYHALEKGDKTPVPFIEVDLAPHEESLALTILDSITRMAVTDRDNLDALLREVETDNAALQSLLSGLAEAHDLYFGDTPPPIGEDVGPQINRADELQAQWQVKRGDVWTIGNHRLMCGDSTNADDVVRLMGGVKASCVITDPPYNLDMESWDNEFSLARLLDVIAPHFHGFMATFCQMPIMLQFAVDLQSHNMIYRDCVVWLKRMSSTAALPLNRSYENILLYSTDKSISYVETKGYYTDVKLPLVEVGALSFDAIDRYIKDLQHALKEGKKSPILSDRNTHNAAFRYMPLVSDRSPEFANFTNVWSFTPEAQATRGDGHGDHPTMKPVKALVRLCELLAKTGDTVFDPFLGSGTTLVACEQTGQRGFGMEISEAYCAVTLQRLADMGLTPTRESSTHEIEF